jgi:hypothetical protein
MTDWRTSDVYRCPAGRAWRVLAAGPSASCLGRQESGPTVALLSAELDYLVVKRTDDPDLQKLERIDG